MKTKLTKSLIAIVSFLGFTITYPSMVFAADVCSSGAAESVQNAAGCSGSSDLSSAITSIADSVIAVCGLVAVVFIIFGGIQYITSTGKSEKTKQAASTILYAVIGLIVCALAFVIVNWIIGGLLKQ